MATSSSISAEAPAIRGRENWWAEARAVFVKDVRSELRTRSAVGTILMFAFVAVVLTGYLAPLIGLGLTQTWVSSPSGAVLQTGQTATRANVLAALYWILLYFSSMAGLPRVFAKEEESRTSAALRLTARTSAVFAGKLAFNALLLELVNCVLLPMYLLLLQPQVKHWTLLVALVVVGAIALAGAATILGAIAARASNGSYLMLVLGFGPLLPILILGINGTAVALGVSGGNNLVGLVSYLVVMTLVSAALFPHVWEE